MSKIIPSTYLIIIIISFICSLISFRLHYPFHLKLLAVLLEITVITEMLANYGVHMLGLSSNYPVYNVFMLLQYILLGFYYQEILQSKKARIIAILFLVLYPLLWIAIFSLVYTITQWNTYGVMAGDLFIIIFSARYLYEQFTSDRLISFGKHTEFWIAVALIFYSCCELPITGILNYLVHDWNNNRTIILNLFSILQVLNIVMYAIFIYAFLCRVNLSKQK